MLKRIMNSSGVSIIEATIGLGIIGILSLGIVGVNKLTTQNDRGSKVDTIIDALAQDLQFRLRVKTYCDDFIADDTLDIFVLNNQYNSSLNVVAGAGALVQLSAINYSNFNQDASSVQVDLSFTNLSDSNSTQVLSKSILIRAYNDGTSFITGGGSGQGCIGESEIISESLMRNVCKDICEISGDSYWGSDCDVVETLGYEKCRRAIASSVKRMKKELCENMPGGYWDSGNSRCHPNYSQSGNCVGNETARSFNTATGQWTCGTPSYFNAPPVCDVTQDSLWSPWMPQESSICSGTSFDQERFCLLDSTVRDGPRTATGTNAGACTCGSGNSCPDDPSISGAGPCSGRTAGELVSCSEPSCNDLVCEANTCDPSLVFPNEQTCIDAFSYPDVTCRNTTSPYKDYHLLSRQGYSNGGTSQPLICPDGMEMIGVHGRAGTLVDAMRVVCKDLDTPGSPTHFSSQAGMNGGTPFQLNCPADQMVIGVHGRDGELIDKFGIICGDRDGSNRWTSPTVGLSNGGTAFNESCNANTQLRGFTLRAGRLIDTFTPRCWEEQDPGLEEWSCYVFTCDSICDSIECKPEEMTEYRWGEICYGDCPGTPDPFGERCR